MTRSISLAVLTLAAVLSAPAQNRKVVLTSPGSYYFPFDQATIAEFRAAAPGITLVPFDKERLMAELADADGAIGNITPEMIRAAKKLRWVQVVSAGAEGYLTPELKNSEITLTNCKILQGPEIADHAFALLLALTRDLRRGIPWQLREEWSTREFRPLELRGKTAVVIGVGGIGTEIATRAWAFGMKVIAVDPRDIPLSPMLSLAVPPDRLDTVLPQADVVFISAPLTPQSQKMFGARQFGLMKKGSFFVAVSRGKIFDGAALTAALETRHLAGAGLDVTDPEPLPKGHPLWKMENVVITPHMAGRSDGENARYLALFKENLRRFAAGEPLLNVVDKQKGF